MVFKAISLHEMAERVSVDSEEKWSEGLPWSTPFLREQRDGEESAKDLRRSSQ